MNRLKKFDEFIGETNKKVIEKIKIVIQASQIKKESPPHILLYGNAGCGKTTIANIIANELGYKFKTITGGTIKTQLDICKILCEIYFAQTENSNITLFIDEIHKLNSAEIPEELWLPILEDFTFYNNLKGKTVDIDEDNFVVTTSKIKVNPFLIIGATTDPGELSNALRTRFGLHCSLKEYTNNDLKDILYVYSKKGDIKIDTDACYEVAKRGRGNPRISLNLFKLIKDKALIENKQNIDKEFVINFLEFMDLDECGLTEDDIKVLYVLSNNLKGMGISNLSGTSGMSKSTLEEIILPFLQFKRLVKTTHKRFITEEGMEYLNKFRDKLEDKEKFQDNKNEYKNLIATKDINQIKPKIKKPTRIEDVVLGDISKFL